MTNARDQRTPSAQATFIMNEAHAHLNQTNGYESYLSAMCRSLIQLGWTDETAPSAEALAEDGYVAYLDECPETYDAAVDALILLATVRGDENADSAYAAHCHNDGWNDGVYETLEGRIVGIGNVLRQYGFLPSL